MTQTGACRFCRLYALSVPGFAALIGAWTSVQFLLEPRVGLQAPLLASLQRATAPAASGSALLLALVLWARLLPPSAVARELPRTLRRALLVSLPGYLLALLVATLTAWAVMQGVSLASFVSGLRSSSLAFGAGAALLDAALISLLAWRFLERGELEQGECTL